uniref:MADF domain-containing protein n=1 Tax=Caenorhabditis tropicalis TaxID=1561998 RepID=A0A1I7T8C2_9PELO
MSAKDEPGCSLNFEIEDEYVMNEPSPLDRILADGRSFNAGNWSSVELNYLCDGVIKYGTRPEAINYIHRNLVKMRTDEELKAKIDEIREIIKEHKELILPEAYRKKWLETGHRNMAPPIECDVDQNEDWSGIICKVINHHQSSITKHFNPMREVFEKVFEQFSLDSRTKENAKVTGMATARATRTETQHLRWPLIYQFMKAAAGIEEQMPPLNELEAAVVSKVLDLIENEAAEMPDSEKSILMGLFTECQIGDFRHTEQDYPPNLLNCVQLFVDPLRTRFHGVPEVGEEVNLEAIQPNSSTSSTSTSATK